MGAKKNLIKYLKNHFYTDLHEYCPIPLKEKKIIFSSPHKIIFSMPPKPRGCPPKKCCNFTGLQNSSSSAAPLATSKCLSSHIQVNRQFLFIINPQPMLLYHPMLSKLLRLNKSDSGKQHKQCHTVIPESNPVAEHHGKTQKMTLKNGQSKGMQHVIQEHGFNVSKLCAKCSPVCPIENTNCCMACLLSH